MAAYEPGEPGGHDEDGYGIRAVPASAGITARKTATDRPSTTRHRPSRGGRGG